MKNDIFFLYSTEEERNYVDKVINSIRIEEIEKKLDWKKMLWFPIKCVLRDPEYDPKNTEHNFTTPLVLPIESYRDEKTKEEFVPLYTKYELLGVMKYWRSVFLDDEKKKKQEANNEIVQLIKYDYIIKPSKNKRRNSKHFYTDERKNIFIEKNYLIETYLSK